MSEYNVLQIAEAIKQEVGVLSENEKQLILIIRHSIRFGDIKIEVQNGKPIFVVKTTDRTILG